MTVRREDSGLHASFFIVINNIMIVILEDARSFAAVRRKLCFNHRGTFA